MTYFYRTFTKFKPPKMGIELLERFWQLKFWIEILSWTETDCHSAHLKVRIPHTVFEADKTGYYTVGKKYKAGHEMK